MSSGPAWAKNVSTNKQTRHKDTRLTLSAYGRVLVSKLAAVLWPV